MGKWMRERERGRCRDVFQGLPGRNTFLAHVSGHILISLFVRQCPGLGLSDVVRVARHGATGEGQTHYYFVLLCRMVTFTKILPASVFAFDWSSQITSPPPPLSPPPLFHPLCNLCSLGGVVCPHCTPCYVTNQSIKMLPLFPLSAIPFLSINAFFTHICSAANPSNAVSSLALT